MILTVTGHRPPKVGGYKIPNPVYEAVVEALDRCLMQLRPERVITGMALGVDQWVAELCIQNDIPFTAAIPCDNFDAKWFGESQLNYKLLLNLAQEVKVVSPGPYSPEKPDIRNRWMVDHGNEVLALWDGERSGGTWKTVDYASKVGKPVHVVSLAPEIWSMAKDENHITGLIRQHRDDDRHERFLKEARRQAQIDADQEKIRERADRLARAATRTLEQSRAREEQRRRERIEEERKEREEIRRVREEEKRRLIEEDRKRRILAAQVELERKREQEEAERKAEAEHSQRLKPKRIIDIGD